jgi:hypothetical protein
MFEVGIQKIQNFLGFHRFRKGREGTDITKKHRHMITFRSSLLNVFDTVIWQFFSETVSGQIFQKSG